MDEFHARPLVIFWCLVLSMLHVNLIFDSTPGTQCLRIHPGAASQHTGPGPKMGNTSGSQENTIGPWQCESQRKIFEQNGDILRLEWENMDAYGI